MLIESHKIYCYVSADRSPARKSKKNRTLSPGNRRASGNYSAHQLLARKASTGRPSQPSALDSDPEDKENGHSQQPKNVNTRVVFVKRRQPSVGGAAPCMQNGTEPPGVKGNF
jgi:hypothetical protein